MSGHKGGFLGPLAAFALRYPKTAATAASSASAVSNATTAVATALTGATKAVADSTPVTFIMAHWKFFLGLLIAIVACVSAFIWIKHDEKVHYDAGYSASQSQYSAALLAAGKQASSDQTALTVAKQKYDDLSKTRQIQVVTVTKPIIERVTREVQSDPVFSSCTVSDSVFNDLQAETAAVDASIAASER